MKSLQQISNEEGIPTAYLRAWIRSGELKAILTDKGYRVSSTDLEKWFSKKAKMRGSCIRSDRK